MNLKASSDLKETSIRSWRRDVSSINMSDQLHRSPDVLDAVSRSDQRLSQTDTERLEESSEDKRCQASEGTSVWRAKRRNPLEPLSSGWSHQRLYARSCRQGSTGRPNLVLQCLPQPRTWSRLRDHRPCGIRTSCRQRWSWEGRDYCHHWRVAWHVERHPVQEQ